MTTLYPLALLIKVKAKQAGAGQMSRESRSLRGGMANRVVGPMCHTLAFALALTFSGLMVEAVLGLLTSFFPQSRDVGGKTGDVEPKNP
jgi:hypothetical protein